MSRSWIQDAERVDLAIYAAVAATSTPTLDAAMSRLTNAANYSRLSVAAAAFLAVAGGQTGPRAATTGLASLAVTATVVNVAIKPLARRRRPGHVAGEVPLARHVRMPVSRSFPSRHAAAAFAFAGGVGDVLPVAAVPLRALAAVVGYSRVHTGVHYPADVLIGTTLAQLTTHVCRVGLPRWLWPRGPWGARLTLQGRAHGMRTVGRMKTVLPYSMSSRLGRSSWSWAIEGK